MGTFCKGIRFSLQKTIEKIMRGSNLGLFLDRDGTINVEKHFIKDPDDLQLIPRAAEAIRKARELGLKVIVVSNQSGVSRGYITEHDVQAVNNRLIELLGLEGATIDGIYYCPHSSEESNGCECRKPNIGMFLRAHKDHDIDLSRSFMVGDRMSDMEAGRNIGATTIFVLTGYGSTLRDHWNARPKVIDMIVPSLYDSIPFIENRIAEWKVSNE